MLLAGLSVAVLGASPAYANTVTWGAIKPPTDIFKAEPARKAKKAKKAKPVRTVRSEPVVSLPVVTRPRAETTGSGIRETIVVPTSVADKPKVAKSKKEKAAKIEKSEPAIPAGPLHVIVSVDAQRASLYANGTFVASTKVSTGTKTHPTPLGVFSVIQKNRHHISNLYGAPMPYMQRLTWSGTAMHTGPLPGYPASHGCIRLTDDFAQLLWKATKIGARVIVTRGEVAPFDISHARLTLPAAPTAQSQPETTGAVVRTADATASVATPDPTRPPESFQPVQRNVVVQPPSSGASIIDRKISPISIFVSRKDGKLYVRQAMQPLFEMPLTFRDSSEPVGTHVFTAMEMKDGAMRWMAVSIPSSFPRDASKPDPASGKSRKKAAEPAAPAVQAAAPNASGALDRFELPREALDRLAGLIIPGSSLIVSDNPLSSETGRYTDFIVLTR